MWPWTYPADVWTDPFPVLPEWLDQLSKVGENLRHDVLGNHFMLTGDVVQLVHHTQESLHARETNTQTTNFIIH